MDVFVGFIVTTILSASAGAGALAAARRLSPKSFSWMRNFLQRRADGIFLALVAAYIFVFGFLAIARYMTFSTGYTQFGIAQPTAWDLGQYTQILWNSLNGRLLENTYILDAPIFLGKSFTPILLALVPLYAVWRSPIVLLIVQTLGLGLSALPLYWFVRARLGRGLGLVLGLAYLLFPGLENIGLSEFHEIAFATPLLAYATFFLLRRYYPGFLVCLALALLVKEEIAFIAIVFGVYIFFVQHQRRAGLALALFGAMWAVSLLQYVIPFVRSGNWGSGFYYFSDGQIGGGGARYGYLGRNLSEIFATILTRPDVIFNAIWTLAKIEYLLHFLAPLMFAPLAGIEIVALALPTLGYSLLSNYALQTSIRSYYFAPLLPFIFFAAAIGLERVLQKCASNRAIGQFALGVMLVVSSGVNYFLQAPGPFGRYFESHRYIWNEHAALGHELLRSIPDGGLVVAQNEYLAALSNRAQIYEVPIPDYRQIDYLFADATRPWYNVHREIWEALRASGYFETLAARDGFWVARRKSPENILNVRFGKQITLVGSSMVMTNTAPWGLTLRPVIEWRAEQPITETYHVVINVVDQQGHIWATTDAAPRDGAAPTNRWQVGKALGDQYAVHLPPTMPTADYRVTVALRKPDGDDYLNARAADGADLGDEAEIATVHLEKNKKSFTASDLHLLATQFADMGELRFLGYVAPRETIAPGELLQVGVYWRAREKPRNDYLAVIQLRDASGRVAFEQASRPANGTYPTTEWDAGEVLLDWHDFDLPRDLAIGKYQIFAVLRDAATGTRVGETLISTISVVK
jgi:uncharacterized membrane protein